MLQRRSVVFVAVLALMGGGCGRQRVAPPASRTSLPAPKPGVKLVPDIAARNTRFAFNLFHKLEAAAPQQNLFISPFSVSVAMGMAYYGAAGSTARAMAQGMEWQGADAEQVNQTLLGLRGTINPGETGTLAIADSMWMRKGVAFKPQFVKALEGMPDMHAATLDFDQRGADTINRWVNQQTRGLIPTITDAGELSQAWLALLDAIYFKAKWQEVFEKSATRPAPFKLLDGGKKNVPMMDHSGRFQYLENDQFQAIALPYKGSPIAAYVFLPRSRTGLHSLVQTMTPEKWNGWIGRMESRPGTIKLPRFTAADTLPLVGVLSQLGMGAAFDPQRADLSGMCNEPMFISLVKQRAYLKVNEEGTEAAAVTHVMGGPGIAAPVPEPPPPFQMIVDHPFFLAIYDEETKTILFMGEIVDPQG